MSGIDAVEKIAAVETGNVGYHSDVPLEDVILEKSERVADWSSVCRNVPWRTRLSFNNGVQVGGTRSNISIPPERHSRIGFLKLLNLDQKLVRI